MIRLDEPNRCHTLGCPNQRWQGKFFGDFCGPCYEVYKTGIVPERDAQSGKWYGAVPRLEAMFHDRNNKEIISKLVPILAELDSAVDNLRSIMGRRHRAKVIEVVEYHEDCHDDEGDDTIGEDFLGMRV